MFYTSSAVEENQWQEVRLKLAKCYELFYIMVATPPFPYIYAEENRGGPDNRAASQKENTCVSLASPN